MAKTKKPANRLDARSPANRLNCVDLFAGAGGFSLAAKRAGLNVAAAVEFDTHACNTYDANLVSGGKPRLYRSDINQVEPADILRDCFPDNRVCDIVLGGPPCQGFSTHRIKDSGVDDPRNQLVHRYFRFVSVLQPKMFLMENVPGLLWSRHEGVLSEFYRHAEAAGYKAMVPAVLDARDYGVPQRRKRVFILGVREDIDFSEDWVPEPTHVDPRKASDHSKLRPWMKCADVFKGAPQGDPNDKHMRHSAELVEVFKKTPPNGGSRKDSGRVLQCHQGHDGHKDVYGRIDKSAPAPTMTTACINPSKGRFVHPTQHHGITIRQAARIQTFPDSFVFSGGLIAAGVQVGNAVPIQLGEVILKHLERLLVAHPNSKGLSQDDAYAVAAE